MSRVRFLSLGIALCLVAAVFIFVPTPSSESSATAVHGVGLVDPSSGRWHLYDGAGVPLASFFYGNPGDYPFMGDWDCDGNETPGLYRQSDGYAYLRNSNTQGVADVRFFFGNPGDIPIAGDFNGDGCDTLSIYRPSNQTFYIINRLGKNDGGLGAAEVSYVFGNPGDKPFVGDFDGDGVETVGLHRESTGLVYFRNSHTQGIADSQFFFGDPDDRLIAGDWTGAGIFTPALFRPSNTMMYFRYTNTQGNADRQWIAGESGWLPVSGWFGATAPPPTTTSTTTTYPPTTSSTSTTSTTSTSTTSTTSTTTTMPPDCEDEITVSYLDDPGGVAQLREAIHKVCDGGTIKILPGTLVLKRGQLVIPADRWFTITSSTQRASDVTIDGDAKSRVFLIEAGADVTISHLTVTNGHPRQASADGLDYYGGGIRNLGTLNFNSGIITDNHAGLRGGGLSNEGTMVVRESVVSHNASEASPGAGIWSSGALTVVDSQIISNRTENSGSGYGGGISSSGTANIVRSNIDGNGAARGGGGISNGGEMVILGCNIRDNYIGTFSGGGIRNRGTLTVTDSLVSGNSAPNFRSGSGGGIDNGGTLVVNGDSKITANRATRGGGIGTYSGSVTIKDTATITGNTAATHGGGIYNSGGTVWIGPYASVTGNTPDDYYEPCDTEWDAVAYWCFDYYSDPIDDGAGDNDAALFGPTFDTGDSAPISGNRASLGFNGTSDYAEVRDRGGSANLDGFTGLTLAAWIKPDTLTSPWGSRVVLSKYHSASPINSISYWFTQRGDEVEVFVSRVRVTDEDRLTSSGVDLTTGTWRHVAGTWDGSYLRLYVDGTEVASKATTVASMDDSTVPVNIGAAEAFADGKRSALFSGSIDEAYIFNRALTAAEIERLADGDPPAS